MKFIIASILFIALLAQTFDSAFITLGYYVNSSAYAQNCENKDKPMMHCCGKCQLRKKLLQEEKNKQAADKRGENKNEVFYFNSCFATVLPIAAYELKIQYPRYSDDKETRMPRSIFHPPGASA
ncbi:MAG TPA: hypothetical protein VK705_13115 [Ferruginibacter sp.]|jgi:hypothetical protein|nr:hypothetical protein [Ferruginibacter sp.]